MNGEFLLDTNAVIALLDGDMALRELVADSPRLLLSIIVLGELYHGAQNSRLQDDNLARIELLILTSTLIYCDQGTAWEYGIIKKYLRSKGWPLPENDIWLAALARQHGLVLMTRDKHFQEIERLNVSSW
ncbi:MAG: type II toxin-antitoxin system VapC family toxin [Thermoguttaceae bacterium]|jgi:tRNA(fMet)-specific endonuclease VapC